MMEFSKEDEGSNPMIPPGLNTTRFASEATWTANGVPGLTS